MTAGIHKTEMLIISPILAVTEPTALPIAISFENQRMLPVLSWHVPSRVPSDSLENSALICHSYFNNPRRTATGTDFNRVNLLMAVLGKTYWNAVVGL